MLRISSGTWVIELFFILSVGLIFNAEADKSSSKNDIAHGCKPFESAALMKRFEKERPVVFSKEDDHCFIETLALMKNVDIQTYLLLRTESLNASDVEKFFKPLMIKRVSQKLPEDSILCDPYGVNVLVYSLKLGISLDSVNRQKIKSWAYDVDSKGVEKPKEIAHCTAALDAISSPPVVNDMICNEDLPSRKQRFVATQMKGNAGYVDKKRAKQLDKVAREVSELQSSAIFQSMKTLKNPNLKALKDISSQVLKLEDQQQIQLQLSDAFETIYFDKVNSKDLFSVLVETRGWNTLGSSYIKNRFCEQFRAKTSK